MKCKPVRNRLLFYFVNTLTVALFSGCGPGYCLNQASCPDGSWISGASFLDFMASAMHREKTAPQMTLKAELQMGATALPAGYRKVPKIGNFGIPIAGDDDGYLGGGVTFAQRPTAVCGTNQPTVALRISDCAVQNPTRSTWEGAVNGNASQGTWRLVTYNGAHEVWRDERTSLLWSDRLGATNWCRASGSSGGGPFAEADPNNVCDNVTYQNQVTPESWCTEDPGLSTPGTYDSMKGGMRLAASGTSPQVVWRLPTKWDFHQAELDGIRFVLPVVTDYMWSASINSDDRGTAWCFRGSIGWIFPDTRSVGVHAVRCVGR